MSHWMAEKLLYIKLLILPGCYCILGLTKMLSSRQVLINSSNKTSQPNPFTLNHLRKGDGKHGWLLIAPRKSERDVRLLHADDITTAGNKHCNGFLPQKWSTTPQRKLHLSFHAPAASPSDKIQHHDNCLSKPKQRSVCSFSQYRAYIQNEETIKISHVLSLGTRFAQRCFVAIDGTSKRN